MGGMHPHVPKNAKCNWLIEDDKTILRNPPSSLIHKYLYQILLFNAKDVS